MWRRFPIIAASQRGATALLHIILSSRLLKVYPDDFATARGFLEGFKTQLYEACAGQISEIFDAEPPYTPRGCCAQAWSVAEVLRSFIRTSDARGNVEEKAELVTASVE